MSEYGWIYPNNPRRQHLYEDVAYECWVGDFCTNFAGVLVFLYQLLSDSGCFQPDVRSCEGGPGVCRVSCVVSLSCPG